MAGVKTDEGRARRVEMFEFIQAWIKTHKYPPRTQDICEGIGMVYTTALWHFASLRSQGFIAYEDGAIGRTLRLGRKRNVEEIE